MSFFGGDSGFKTQYTKKMDKLYNSMCFMVSEFYLKNEKYLR